MKLTLRVWRQSGAEDPGRMVSYAVDDISPDMSFLEMLDILNQDLIIRGEQPVAFDHDCREGFPVVKDLIVDKEFLRAAGRSPR